MAKAQDTSKEAKAAAKAARKAASKERRQQIWQAFQMQRKEDKALIPLMAGVIVGVTLIFVLLSLLANFGPLWLMIPLGLILGVLLSFILFGRRVQKTVYRKADGQPGAAGWALGNIRGQWRVQQAVAGTSHLDAVHRVIGKPGVILVAEGQASRIKPLMAQEKKKVARVVGDTPVYEVMVGDGEGEVPLAKLERYIRKLPNNIDRNRMEAVDGRLSALKAKGGAGAALPKGPMPQGAKMRSAARTVRRR
ncbi:membrane protein [Gordonia spumicola]|uniref:Membrane protein n=1 Tax=Gordonia spumicola TaxID=589161 RepID=A0A7I9VEE4_9ACTN|nr:DUF4191 domain-containing protein [Gordonia spumicola]GEE03400.1 membrane protein [Gordonia spumicola]